MTDSIPSQLTPEMVKKLGSLFFKQSTMERERFAAANGRFVHYTSAEAAMSIFKNKEFWMRDVSTMNDFMELEHGLDCLVEAWKSELGDKFKAILNEVKEGLAQETAELFDFWTPLFKRETFLTSLSEHDPSEDDIGRLSMWRAYGGKASVALVLNRAPFYTESDSMKVYSSPVSYLTKPMYLSRFEEITELMKENIEFLRECGDNAVKIFVFHMFRFDMLCTKHIGFQEEREWRIIYSPNLESSKYVEPAIVSLLGIPQTIQKIPLVNHPEDDVIDIELPELIERVIIGPTEYPKTIRDAFIKLMKAAGIDDAENKVYVSNIPLRT